MEAYLTNGKVYKSNVLDVETNNGPYDPREDGKPNNPLKHFHSLTSEFLYRDGIRDEESFKS